MIKRFKISRREKFGEELDGRDQVVLGPGGQPLPEFVKLIPADRERVAFCFRVEQAMGKA